MAIREISATLIKGKLIKDVTPTQGKELLVYRDGKIIVRHGPEANTATGGNSNTIFIIGTKEEIDNRIKALGLITQEDQIKAMEPTIVGEEIILEEKLESIIK